MRSGPLVILIRRLLGGAIFGLLALPSAFGQSATHALPPAEAGNVVVGLCDGKTLLEVTWAKPGQRVTPEQAREVSNALMAKWRAQHPKAIWQIAQAQTNQSGTAQPAAQQGQAEASASANPVQRGRLRKVDAAPPPNSRY
jgi:hypothetical protein